jgi:flagellar hook assembly protein FlgD
MKQQGKVNISVYNVIGQLVEILFDGEKSAGIHTVTFDSKLNSSGVYIYRMEVRDKVFNKKMLLLK